ncbi:MAG: AAA family ATPase [Candidatus Magasanikbacteria bacterium]|nr:AAA family ATPase [Candidatus Magasanikbacteria bacterium]MCA9390807.1 AAA family ATPase [Candidatus Magasanikbacteria bacterium]
MSLKRIEIQGFKTFAQKTTVEFRPDAGGQRTVTAVVGPNGSGKSNIADAIRWVMGEQSMRLLRGKKSEDVIFSGTEKRSRSGFAEVTMVLDNADPEKTGIGTEEIQVTRRLYRDGQSEYEVNKQSARLSDVALLLAQAGIGQRTYSVIGQGMIDQVLVASPMERREFFDEAFGLKPFQMKRTQAMNKMDDSRKNIGQIELMMNELGPRLTLLEKQVKRLAEREKIEEELHALEKAYYGHEWRNLDVSIKTMMAKLQFAKQEETTLETQAQALEAKLAEMEKTTPQAEGFRERRAVIDKLREQRASFREQELKLETKRAVAEVRAEKPWVPLPLTKIIEQVESFKSRHETLKELLSNETPDLEALRKQVSGLLTDTQELVSKLQRPAPEPEKAAVIDTSIEEEWETIQTQKTALDAQIKEAEQQLEAWQKEEDGKRSHIFDTQRALTKLRHDAQSAERRGSEASIELARLETRREGVLADVRLHAPHLEEELLRDEFFQGDTPSDTPTKMQRLRSQLEWIGGIDPETIKEYEETKKRSDELEVQLTDIREGLQALETVVAELDTTINERAKHAFERLNKEFARYFKTLFGGGEAQIIELQPEVKKANEEDEDVDYEEAQDDEQKKEERKGIDIMVTPPGKRFKSISLLSGGERALTSIALICAIMATNPSPFVVLDEVDAALDETNSRKFAEIVASLADKTQFIVVTHNRATMAKASLLYGVTMGDDGVSQLLSVSLEEVEKMRNN